MGTGDANQLTDRIFNACVKISKMGKWEQATRINSLTLQLYFQYTEYSMLV